MRQIQGRHYENSFLEHLGLVGGVLLVAWLDLRKS